MLSHLQQHVQDVYKENCHLKDYIHKKIAVNPENKTEINKTKKCQVKNKIPLIKLNGQTLYKEDLNSLKEKQWLTDRIIDLQIIAILKENEKTIKDNKIRFVDTAITIQLRTITDKTSIRQVINNLKLTESNWVLYVINNSKNPDAWNTGDHWSLLIYSKEHHQYHHFDPIRGNPNAETAKELIMNMLDKDSFIG